MIDEKDYPWDCWCGERHKTARSAWMCRKCRKYLFDEDMARREVTNVVTGEIQKRISESRPEGR